MGGLHLKEERKHPFHALEVTFMSVEPSWASHTLLLRFVIQVEAFNAIYKCARDTSVS